MLQFHPLLIWQKFPEGGDNNMSKNFLSYVWAFSARQQLVILILTAASFPLLYMTLELPKQIINDAIGGDQFPYTILGFSFDQIEYLFFLCAAYLFFVLSGGLLKMQTNTYKGVVGERLLRRLRYQLIQRVMRFPLSYFKQAPQGSLISMVTAETESIGAMMGEAFARPLFSAGQMLTILTFLFVQSVWLGLAAVAMIPVQAWIVPRLQRKINQLNKKRIIEVRSLSEHIGETVRGADDLRSNGGVTYALALFSHRFGDIFNIRLEIYKRKFFLKFLNNTLNQVTPFFLLLIGGYLTINGQLTVGALAAALASYKDLLGPWRELLVYYSQIQDTALRYRTVTEQFDPPNMIDENLIFDQPDEIPSLTGAVVLHDATISDQFGTPVLTSMNAEFPAGSMIAIRSQSASVRQAVARTLARAVIPSSGTVSVGGHDLSTLHQGVISARIGLVSADPAIFDGTIERNAQMSLLRTPRLDEKSSPEVEEFIREAKRVGNSANPVNVPWVDASIADVGSEDELRDWWAHIIRKIGFDPFLMRRSLRSTMSTSAHPELAQNLVGLRNTVKQRLVEEGLDSYVQHFDFESFNPALTAIENALYAIRKSSAQTPGGRIDPDVWKLINQAGVADYHREWSYDLLDTIVQTFSGIGVDHPMFQRLVDITPESFDELQLIHRKKQRGQPLTEQDDALVYTLPLSITADQLGDAFPDDLREFVITARKNAAVELQNLSAKYYDPIREDQYIDALPMLENIVFGRVAWNAQVEAEKIQELVIEELERADFDEDVLLLVGDLETGFSGSKVDPIAFERIAFVRATIKRPDVLILDRPFANALPEIQEALRTNLRALLPDATIIQLEADLPADQFFDKTYEIRDGWLVDLDAVESAQPFQAGERATTATGDLSQKLRVLSQVKLLSQLERPQLRLLAYGATWMKANKGDFVFKAGDQPDGAYILVRGDAELRWPTAPDDAPPITEIEPGRLIGDLAVILDEPRAMHMIATSDIVGLKLGNQVLNDVINHDAGVAANLLRTVSGYLLTAAGRLGEARTELDELKQHEDA